MSVIALKRINVFRQRCSISTSIHRKRVKAIKIKQFSAPSLAAVEGRGSNKGVRNTLHHSHD